MEELKMQNGLLLQLINSKNRQNQILFQQYEQLAQDNQLMQAQIDRLKSQSHEGRRASGSQLQEAVSRHSAFDAELADLKKKCGEYVAAIGQLKRQLEEKGGAIIFLQNQLKNAKLQPEVAHDTEQLKASLKEISEILASKERSLSELTEYMNQQAEKISELTNAGIIVIENYEAKLQEKQKANEQLRQQISEITQQLQQYEEKAAAEAAAKDNKLENAQEQKLKDLQTIILSKEQSISQLSEFLEQQTEKVTKLEADLSESNLQALQEQINSMKAKITQYERYLNEKEEEMAAIMEVMENLQAEIQGKNQEIQKLQQLQSAQPNFKMQEMQAQMDRLRQDLADLQNQPRQSQPINELQQQYQQVQLQQEMLQKSNKLTQAYKQQLQSMQDEQQPNSNAQILMQNEEQIENNEQLTVLQVIQQILIYSQEQNDMPSFLRMIEVLKRSYLRENQCILKENSELKDSLNRIIQVNSAIVEEKDRFTAEIEELKGQIQEKEETNREMEDRLRRLQSNYQQEIKQLRKSISGLKDQSPIIAKQLKQEDLITISKLQDQIIALKQENHKKDAELEHLRAHNNKKFVNELNNLLDSCTVNKDEKDWKELEEELQRANAEKQEVLIKCREYENEIVSLEKRCLQLTMLVENLNSSLAEKTTHIEREKQANRDSEQEEHNKERLIVGFEGPLKFAQEKASIELEQPNQESFQRLKTENQELHGLINDKNFAINELEETLLTLEKGYNSQIMGLRKNIAELQGESIALRKSLYQANPNGVDIGQLIKDTFSQSDRDTQFFRPTFPLYTQHLFDAQPMHTNQSYYSQINRARSNPKRNNYQRYFPTDMSMGQKFMGRKCRQASPLLPYRQEIRANGVWTSNDLQRY